MTKEPIEFVLFLTLFYSYKPFFIKYIFFSSFFNFRWNSYNMASLPKRRRITGLTKLESNYNKKHWISSIMGLCTSDFRSQITLTPMKILNCNATGSEGTPFSKAYCDTEYYSKNAFVFGDAFKKWYEHIVGLFLQRESTKR